MRVSPSSLLLYVALGGVLLSTYSFLHNQGFASGEFCTLNETFNCDIVNKGPYGWFLGVPVSLLGVVGYALMAAGAFFKKKHPTDTSITLFLILSVLGGLAFSLYLTGIEAFVLHAWCIVCLGSQFLMLSSAVTVIWLVKTEKKQLETSSL